MNEQHPIIDPNHDPLMQPITWHGKEYRTSHFLHRTYQANSPHGGKYQRHDSFIRLLKGIEAYQEYIETGDLIVLPSYKQAILVTTGQVGTNENKELQAAFKANDWKRLYLVSATIQVALSHHLDDEVSKKLSVTTNTATARQLSGKEALSSATDAFPELRAIVDLVEGVAQARLAAAAAQRDAQAATLKADLALAQQRWLTIAEYVYLNKLQRQFPRRLWSHFGRYISGYCQEHNIPVRNQPVTGKVYAAEHAYHVEVIEQLLEPWLKRQDGTHLWPVT